MSENTEVVIETPDAEEVQAPQVSEIEQRALEMGWRPKEEFNGSEDDFIDAKEFVRRKPLFDKIEHQSKELKNFRKTLETFKQHYTAVEKAAVAKAYEQLKAARQEAVSNADGDKFEQIDAEIKQVEKQAREIQQMEISPAIQEEPELLPEFVNWQNKNQWYSSVSYMRKFADEVGVQLSSQGVSRNEILKKVEEAVKKEFPHKFFNQNKQSAPDVESSGTQRTNRAERFDLTDIERNVMNTLVKSGQITKEKYLADLKAIKGIK